jgi:hypothetical protein
LILPISAELEAAEAPQPKRLAPRKAVPAKSDDDAQGSLF